MKALLTIILFGFSYAGFAADVGYEVEVIVFEDVSSVYDFAEKWSAEADNTATSTDQKLSNQAPSSKARFQILDASKYRLNRQSEKLEKHPDYKVLIHTAWKQPGLDKKQAFSISLDSRTQNGIASNESATDVDSNQHFVTGDISLIMSRYLHIDSKLALFKPTTLLSTQARLPSSVEAPTLQYQSIPVSFERRMRSREVHYIDHPLVGMIVIATPYKIQPISSPKTPTEYKTL